MYGTLFRYITKQPGLPVLGTYQYGTTCISCEIHACAIPYQCMYINCPLLFFLVPYQCLATVLSYSRLLNSSWYLIRMVYNFNYNLQVLHAHTVTVVFCSCFRAIYAPTDNRSYEKSHVLIVTVPFRQPCTYLLYSTLMFNVLGPTDRMASYSSQLGILQSGQTHI